MVFKNSIEISLWFKEKGVALIPETDSWKKIKRVTFRVTKKLLNFEIFRNAEKWWDLKSLGFCGILTI
jgi:hypothetical protein